ncbi:unnamed protein product, partial [Ixodes hexagonus]
MDRSSEKEALITHVAEPKPVTVSPSKHDKRSLAVLCLILFLGSITLTLQYHFQGPLARPSVGRSLDRRSPNFYGASNVTGFSNDIVPNMVHLIRLDQTLLSFWDAVCIRSIYLNHNPTLILIHCSPCGMEGPYESWVSDIPTLRQVPIQVPEDVFGLKLGCVQHVSDVLRIRVLMEHGGIYLDNDVFVVRSMDRFRRFEMSLGWPEGAYIGNQIQIAHPKARFLRLYHDLYRRYDKSKWYWNAGDLPTLTILIPHQHLVHRSYRSFGVATYLLDWLYVPKLWLDWTLATAVHLFVHHRGGNKRDPLKDAPVNETNVGLYDTAIGEMARSVLYGTKKFVEAGAQVLNLSLL